MKTNPWFRMYNDFIHDEKMEFLAFEDQRHFVYLLCMKNMGLLDKEYPKTGMLDRIVAKRLGLYGEAFDNAKIRLMDVGVIDEFWQPTGWNKRQFISDTDSSNAERQRRYRERQRQARTSDATRNVTVTALDTEAEAEAEDKNLSDGPSAFDIAFAAYPKRSGGNPRAAALKAWNARIKQGVDPTVILEGVQRYAAFVRAEGKEKTRFVKQAATFFGPDGHYLEAYEPSKAAKPKPTHTGFSEKTYVGTPDHEIDWANDAVT